MTDLAFLNDPPLPWLHEWRQWQGEGCKGPRKGQAAVAPGALVAAGGAWWPGLAVSPSELLQVARLLSAAPPVGM
eukprot:CAMPEP_0179885254 /NCGR_PEP_ID=MMETSP0982-20121206/30167_1 /TAXON_ID=483367 /ORGANISM="non described non described, Strain CCMP 2436" /LENGTH=74 /DNA_ID=CAMNT_0021780791 /DNA_START=8 /DNA_END=230 /DNA_ORIENTATION=-